MSMVDGCLSLDRPSRSHARHDGAELGRASVRSWVGRWSDRTIRCSPITPGWARVRPARARTQARAIVGTNERERRGARWIAARLSGPSGVTAWPLRGLSVVRRRHSRHPGQTTSSCRTAGYRATSTSSAGATATGMSAGRCSTRSSSEQQSPIAALRSNWVGFATPISTLSKAFARSDRLDTHSWPLQSLLLRQQGSGLHRESPRRSSYP
jgi:hypothetical protein